MSTPATELEASSNESKPAILEVPGQSALSDFRLRRLLRELQAQSSSVTNVAARFVYFVDTANSALSPAERARLDSILLSGESVGDMPQESLQCTVVPRSGTISPWSSKATDIARACELSTVCRIERGICYAISVCGPRDNDSFWSLARVLFDPMTEEILLESDSIDRLFSANPPAAMAEIPLRRDGIDALRKADEALGLALSSDEINYLVENYQALNRDPTDVELMMFAQANSEHCRHKIFNASWTVDGEVMGDSLFAMIKSTTAANPTGVLSAYSDNAAVMAGWEAERLLAEPVSRRFAMSKEPVHILMKVETHNHPTAISPFPGAATGAGGEIRDEGATGLGAKPKAGLTGFSVSHLRIPGFSQPWESEFPHPDRMATPLEIMLDGPLGGAAFNNEFGRPNLLGYFRTYEQSMSGLPAGEIRGYHKPIMIAGGVGNVREEHAVKKALPAGAAVVVLGGPAMLIGLGGGAASSLSSGSSSEDLDFASVQRGNPEMERRAQEVIDRCTAMGDDNPILLIHDVGAGGLSNAIPEAVDHSGHGAVIDLRSVPNAEPGMSPMAIWCNEAQERYVLIVESERFPEFEALCTRERCPCANVGVLTVIPQLVVLDSEFGNVVVDMPMEMLLGKTPKMQRKVFRSGNAVVEMDLTGIELSEAINRVLRFPAVADKSFLINIGDRTVGGLTVRDQMIGPWQVPVSDVAITASSYGCRRGEAMAMGERTPVAAVNAPASGRLAVTEALTNIVAAPIEDLRKVRLSANWMAAAGHPGEDANLFDTVKAVGSQLCRELGIAIPVGKDSLSMKTTWQDGSDEFQVVAPVSLIVSAFAPVTDVSNHLTAQLQPHEEPSSLLLLDLGNGKNRLGASCLSQVFNLEGGKTPDLDSATDLVNFFAAIQALRSSDRILAYHDRSDGGLLATIAEMMFASRLGVTLTLHGSNSDMLAQLFSEEPGGVIQVAQSKLQATRQLLDQLNITYLNIGAVQNDDSFSIVNGGEEVLRFTRETMQMAWSETSWRMQSLRDNPETALEEFSQISDASDPGLTIDLSFAYDGSRRAPAIGGRRPRIAILREQGVNSQYEMAAAFLRADFEAIDVHMHDLLTGRDDLREYQGIVACGGFSYGDVLGAGGGWAKSILYQPVLRDQFANFFARTDSFALGVCNGCQMMSLLREIIPGAGNWPRFLRNRSEQFEARLSLVEIAQSPSIFLAGMAGSRLPIATSHGEGRAVFDSDEHRSNASITLRYVDNFGQVAKRYPQNPNGSEEGVCGLSSKDGKVTIMMPHPERVALTAHNAWHPDDWGEEGPWMQMFHNARDSLR